LLAIKGGMASGQAVEWLRSVFHIEIETEPKSSRQIVATYNYRDERGDLLFQVCRFDPKDFRQRRPDGSGGWEWKVKGTRQVPYRLPELIAAPPDSIIYVPEGEKDVNNLVKLELTATCNPGGATSRRADGRPATSKWRSEFNQFFCGRDVRVIADNDAAGRDHARAIERALAPVAKRVCILELPGLPPKGDVTDWLAAGGTRDELERLAASACDHRPARAFGEMEASDAEPGIDRGKPAYQSFCSYRMGEDGLFFDPDDSEKPPIWLSASFEILAHTRDADGSAWGKLLRWHDLDGRVHEWPMPVRALGGGRDDLWRELLDAGLQIASNFSSRNKLADYLSAVQVTGRARAVPRIGWHVENNGSLFVLPDVTYGDAVDERVLWQADGRAETEYLRSGSAIDWRNAIGGRCIGNSRLVLAVSAAFAAPLLLLANEENGGFHFVGSSRAGKTTVLRVAGSVWGGGGIGGYLRSWRATSNGLEGIAEAHCDTLLCLDEMGQVDAREAGEIAYMLANGSGKGRARRDGSPRRPAQWRLLFLSSGEISLGDKMAEIGKRPKAGQEVRLVDIPADAGAGFGTFENLNDAASPGAFAEELRIATDRYHGAPIRQFLELLTARCATDASGLTDLLRASRDDFLSAHLPDGASAQVRSVCGRFALVAAAGSLATAFELTGWPDDEADRAGAKCFRAWLERRGSAGDHEIETGIRQVIAYVEAHGNSRFEAAWEDNGDRVINRVGFRRRGDGECWEYLVLPEQWKSEVTKGFDAGALARVMVERKLLVPAKDGKRSKMVKVPGHGALRLYVLKLGIIGGSADGTDAD
jgi:putative DNA primase/helicase